MTLIRIQRSPDFGETYVSFRYDADVVKLIKEHVPPDSRVYDSGSKVWTIPTGLAVPLENLLTDAGHEIEGVVPRPKRSEHYAKGEGGFFGIDDDDDARATAAALVASITPEKRGAVFREMGRILYPDMYPKRRKK